MSDSTSDPQVQSKFGVNLLYPSLSFDLEAKSDKEKEKLTTNKYALGTLVDMGKSKGPIFSLDLLDRTTNKTLNSTDVVLENRIQPVFNVSRDNQPNDVFPLQFKKIKTFLDQYVFVLGDTKPAGTSV